MKVIVHVNNACHQKEHAAAMREGLRKHGIESEEVQRLSRRDCDVAVIWGYRGVTSQLGKRLLVMERGYLPDRMEWCSIGWGGLNNRATFPECKDFGYRFQSNWPNLLKPWREGGDYVLVCGQYPGDAALYGLNLNQWADSVVEKLLSMGERVIFRPHPLLVRRQQPIHCPFGTALSEVATLEEDLAGAKYCVTYNSNAGVESVCAGVPTITMDKGAMAWPVTSHVIGEPLLRPDRTEWAHQLAWCQWKLNEIADGTAWEALRQVAA